MSAHHHAHAHFHHYNARSNIDKIPMEELAAPLDLIRRSPPGSGSYSSGSSSDDSSDSSSSDSSSSSSSDYSDSSDSSSSSSSSSGSSGSGAPKVGATENTATIAISCAVVIPIVAAICVLFFLHRRNVKRQRLEDLNDKHGSLDFGLGETRRSALYGKRRGKKGQPIPEMSIVDADALRSGKGISIDMGSPYVLPREPESRGSFNSLSKSLHDPDDPYRPVDMMRSRSHSPQPPLPPGSQAGSTASPMTVNSTAHLLSNAQHPGDGSPGMFSASHSSELPASPPAAVTRKPHAEELPGDPVPNYEKPLPVPEEEIHHHEHDTDKEAYMLPTSTFQHEFSLPDIVEPSPTADTFKEASFQPPHGGDSHSHAEYDPTAAALDDYETYADVLGIVQAPKRDDAQLPEVAEAERSKGLGFSGVRFDESRLSTHIRPLPPDDPADTAEQRANRIRSFYKEYFADGEGGYGDYDDGEADYGQEFNGAAIYDPATGQFIVAGGPDGITRRAMTPPPRGPPRRFRGGPAPYGATRSSGGTYPGGRGRAFSSASGRPPPGGRGRPQKKLPPPSPLSTLPTPANLKDDTGIFNAVDFAPPSTVRDRVAGRAQTPLGELRPYKPAVRAHTPLASAFDDLTVMPSPHQLRKSSTFTALDFAPPPRFKENGGGSDSGSIRSGRSGHIDAMHMRNIRAGAYRVSRLPADTVGTVDDLTLSLKPRMDLALR